MINFSPVGFKRALAAIVILSSAACAQAQTAKQPSPDTQHTTGAGFAAVRAQVEAQQDKK